MTLKPPDLQNATNFYPLPNSNKKHQPKGYKRIEDKTYNAIKTNRETLTIKNLLVLPSRDNTPLPKIQNISSYLSHTQQNGKV